MAGYRAKALAEDREGVNAYARAYYRARHPLPPCQTCGKPTHHANARTCHACCPSPKARTSSRESKARKRAPRSYRQ